MTICEVDAHWLPVGVKLYVAEPTCAVLIEAGFHVPEIPSVDVDGSIGAVVS